MPRLILLNKPFGVLCQFSDDGSGKPTLVQHAKVPGAYPAGWLDTDSEGRSPLNLVIQFLPVRKRPVGQQTALQPKLT